MINNGIVRKIRGVLDITGTAPVEISNDVKAGYLNLWNVASNMGVNRFYVVSIKDLNGITSVNARDSWATPEPANVIIYPEKYNTSDISGESEDLRPSYRAFFDGNTPKITPITGISDTAYVGRDTSGTTQVPPLDESSWINAANNNDGAAPGFQSYSAAPKWDATAFNSIAVGGALAPHLSAAPMHSGAYLAGVSGQPLEAVLPKSRVEEAILEALWKDNLRVL